MPFRVTVLTHGGSLRWRMTCAPSSRLARTGLRAPPRPRGGGLTRLAHRRRQHVVPVKPARRSEPGRVAVARVQVKPVRAWGILAGEAWSAAPVEDRPP